MATKSISQLDTQATANETDLFEVAIVDANSASGYASKKESAAAIADAIVGEYQYPLRITGTTAKTIAGAINELKNLVDLLPQFAIEVVQALPVSDISETTIYLVPAQDPEQGNYYEEYIYVNNAWELVGTTAVDLSGYYTSAQVDTLLAAKANTSSLATVATSGAYSDLTGKPTIDTALDDTSTNAVENRAVAGEINSIKSDITVDGSASGDIATFADGSDNSLKALKISIVATQSGSGDPSPSNVRPISGFSAVDITRCAKNFLAKPFVHSSQVTRTINNCFYISEGIYRFSFATSSATSWRIGVILLDKNGNSLSGSEYNPYNGGEFYYDETHKAWISSDNTTRTSFVFSNIKNCYIRFVFLLGDTTTETTFTDVQLVLGNTATPYEPYNGNTYNISWQSTAGTVGGGNVDIVNGEIMVNKVGIKGVTVERIGTSSRGVRYADTTPIYDNLVQNTPTISDRYKQVDTSVPAISGQFRVYNNGFTIYDNRFTDLDTAQSLLNDVEFYYELATPVTYQLTPTEIRSLLGTNNVWADCGAITELKYARDLNLCINDIISRIEALENASSTRSLSVSPVLTKSLTSDSDTAESKTEETEEETKEEAQNER